MLGLVVVREAMVVVRSICSMLFWEAGFQVMTRQKRPRGRKNCSLILWRNLFVLGVVLALTLLSFSREV